jgi:hypothetical protein
MLPPLGTSRRITRCGSRRQSPRRRTCRGGTAGVELRAGLTLGPLDPKGARHSALPAWDAGSLAWVKFCHGNKRCQPPSPLRP